MQTAAMWGREVRMELREALSQITEIRSQMARTETFRGYRSGTVALSGLVAFGVAAVQAVWVPDPAADVGRYLGLWISAAAVCVAVWGVEMVLRCRRATLRLTRQMTLLAVEQFSPCMVAGAVLTWAIVRYAAESVWMLPGMWAVIFSLGVFASCRLLPRPVFWVGAYYLGAGLLMLALARGEAALSPWAMVGTFGVGQLLAAAVLYFTLERQDAEG
jgi:hypothetical protein